MSEKLLRHMFLIALQSTQDGEALAAIRKAADVAKAQGLDAYALADRIVGKTAPPPRTDNSTARLLSTIENLMTTLSVRDAALKQAREMVAMAQAERGRLLNENARLQRVVEDAIRNSVPSSRPPARMEEVEWRRRAQQLLNEKLLPREREFLTSILERGWVELSKRQENWLDDIWAKHFRGGEQ